MNGSVPTPFDIAPLPYFPPEPGLQIWLGILVLFALLTAAALIPKSARRDRSMRVHLPFKEAEAALRKYSGSRVLRKQDLFEISRRIKAVLHAYEESDLSSMGPDELERTMREDLRKPILTDLTGLIVEIDRIKFESDLNELRVRELISELLSTLNTYKHSVRAGMAEEQHALSTE